MVMGRLPKMQQRTDTGKMNRLLVLCIAFVSVPTVYSAADNIAWCYHDSSCDFTTWSVIATQFCNGSRQSPVDIASASAQGDASLTAFNFTKYDDRSALTKIKNTGMTVKVELSSGLQVTGGALSEAYDSLQFHLHWGNGSSVMGSEHSVDGRRFPMELHIVNLKSSLNGNTTLGVQDSTGLAALGFFIEVASGNETGTPASWKTLTSYLANITTKGDYMDISGLSLDDLLVGVDRTRYYRYLGSLTTPTCNEAVVWTVFKDSIKVSRDLIDLFSTTLHIDNTTSSLLMVNTFRDIQPANGRQVTTQTSSSSPLLLGGASRTLLSLALVSLGWLLLTH